MTTFIVIRSSTLHDRDLKEFTSKIKVNQANLCRSQLCGLSSRLFEVLILANIGLEIKHLECHARIVLCGIILKMAKLFFVFIRAEITLRLSRI